MGGGVALRLLGLCGVLFTIGIPWAAASDRVILERVWHTSVADYTRVVITLSGETSYRLLTIPADPVHNRPARIALDFSPAQLGARAPATLPVNNGLLRQVRTGQFSASTARVVLDVERIEDYKAFALYSPYRVVVDIKAHTLQNPRNQQEAQSARTRSALPQVSPRYRIMLDPGHGGHDPGAHGKRGLAEKTVVLAISKRLGRKLAARLPVEVLFTRTTDVFVPLPETDCSCKCSQS